MGKNGKKRKIRTVKLSDIRRVNAKRKGIALRAVRKVDPDFYPGKRTNRFYTGSQLRELVTSVAR